jgi:hypothetical protein
MTKKDVALMRRILTVCVRCCHRKAILHSRLAGNKTVRRKASFRFQQECKAPTFGMLGSDRDIQLERSNDHRRGQVGTKASTLTSWLLWRATGDKFDSTCIEFHRPFFARIAVTLSSVAVIGGADVRSM